MKKFRRPDYERLVKEFNNGDLSKFKTIWNGIVWVIDWAKYGNIDRARTIEDLQEEAKINLFYAIKKYDPSKANFVTYAAKIIRNSIFKSLRKSKYAEESTYIYSSDSVAFNEIMASLDQCKPSIVNDIIYEQCCKIIRRKIIKSRKIGRVRKTQMLKILRMVLEDSKITLKEMADSLEISPQMVYVVVKDLRSIASKVMIKEMEC